MLQLCLGIYMMMAVFAYLIFLGTFLERQNAEENMSAGI